MKKIILSSIVGCLFCFCSSKKIKYPSQAIAIVFDKTDSLLLIKPNAASILSMSNVYKQIDNAYSLSITTISALEHIPVYTVTVGNKGETERYNSSEIPDFRNVVIGQFIQQVKDTIQHCLKDSIIKDFKTSHCFATISKALSSRSFQEADWKYLFVYSDLFEYSKFFNIYHSNASVDEIVKLFEATNLLPKKLTDTKVFVIYQPRNTVDDERFSKMFQVYKVMLEKRGCEVIQKSNL